MQQRFWSKVQIRQEGECWEWQAGKRQKGYGEFWKDGTYNQSHRIAWEIANGPIPEGLLVLHKCDNPPCCNPSHLFLGTNQDNMRDMVNKGRADRSKRGVGHWNTKLSAGEVNQIKELKGTFSQRKLAKMFNISQAQVWNIHNGARWQHLN